MFFARYLSICHEAYEEALAAAGVDLGRFFADHGVVIPIVRSEASYLRPLACGETIRVDLKATRLSEHSFAIDYVILKLLGTVEKRAAVARTEHVCITSEKRERAPLPAAIAAWVDEGA